MWAYPSCIGCSSVLTLVIYRCQGSQPGCDPPGKIEGHFQGYYTTIWSGICKMPSCGWRIVPSDDSVTKLMGILETMQQ